MAGLQLLQQLAGKWHGRYHLYLAPEDPPAESESTLTVTSLLHDTFVRLDQTWAYDGAQQEGSMLIGCEPDTGHASLHWIDTFHNGHGVMVCTGMIDAEGAIDVLGSFPAPPGPDWGWRVRLAAKAAEQLEMQMFCIEPDEPEQLAVSVVYEPTKLTSAG